MVQHLHLGGSGVLPEEGLLQGVGRGGGAEHQAAVELGDLPVPDFLVQHPEGGGVFGAEDQPAGVAVDPVAEGRCKAVFLFRVVFPLLGQIFQDPVDEGVHLALVVGVDHQPGRLIGQEDVFVLIDDFQGVPGGAEGVLLPVGGKKFVLEVQLHHVPLRQAAGDFSPFSVDLDALLADGLVKKALGQQGNGLGEEFVQALPAVVGADDEAFHGIPPGFGFPPIIAYFPSWENRRLSGKQKLSPPVKLCYHRKNSRRLPRKGAGAWGSTTGTGNGSRKRC